MVIPIKNEAKFIGSTINQILSQDYPPDKIEVLVAIGECEDNSREIVTALAAKDDRIRVFNNTVGRSSAGRNIGARNATGEIITFIDGHTYIDNNQLLKNTAMLMEKQNVLVLSRPQFLEPPDNDFFQRAVAMARRSVIGHGLDSTIYTDEDGYVIPDSSGASYRKEVFDKVGFYDERFDACEDVEFNHRAGKAGLESYTSMKLVVYYYPRSSWKALFAQMKRYGRGRFRLAQKHRSTISAGTLIPPLFVLSLPLLLILAALSPIFLNLFILLAGIYILAILAGSILVAIKNGIKYLPYLVLIYPAIHLGLGWGFLEEGWRKLIGRGVDFEK
ncbi:Glycosyltransferase-like protein [Candidatus Zixiibacteriota bacterium]|nr:Glycosyltransferase-like protein [candidate division Zixibacteria bacterium]